MESSYFNSLKDEFNSYSLYSIREIYYRYFTQNKIIKWNLPVNYVITLYLSITISLCFCYYMLIHLKFCDFDFLNGYKTSRV